MTVSTLNFARSFLCLVQVVPWVINFLPLLFLPILVPLPCDIFELSTLFDDFLKWYEEVIPLVPLFTGFIDSTSLGPWILDFGVIDLIYGSRSLFSSFSISSYLPFLTVFNITVFNIEPHLVGLIVSIFQLLSWLMDLLYGPWSKLNLLSLHHLTCFVFIEVLVF